MPELRSSRGRVAALLLMAACLHPPSGAQPAGAAGAAVQVEARVLPRADAPELAELHLTLTDRATQQPLDVLPRQLATWLQKQPQSLADLEVTCTDKVRLLASPGIGRRAAVDLNAYRLLAVNQDHSVTFINPFLRLNNAKLEAVLKLPGEASALLYRPEQRAVWIAVAEADEVLVIDIDTRQVRQRHTLAPGSKPSALLALGPDTWVGQAGRDEWLRFAPGAVTGQPLAAARVFSLVAIDGVSVPAGLAPQGVLLPGTHPQQSVRPVRLASVPRQAAWSALAQRLIVTLADGALIWLNPADGTVTRQLALPPSLVLRLFDDGRYAMLAGAREWQLIDLATGALVQRGSLVAAVADIAFTPQFAYLHSAGASAMLMLSLAELRRGRAQPVHVPVGAQAGAAAEVDAPLGHGTRLQPLPGGQGLFVASPRDGQLYQYAEGLMAPLGSLSNYRRNAQALLMLDDGLARTDPGVYRGVLRVPPTGRYELVLSSVQPRFVHCGTVALPAAAGANTASAGEPPRFTLVHAQARSQALHVLARWSGGDADVPPQDATLLAFDRRSGWQARTHLLALGDGLYEAQVAVPPGLEVELLVGSAASDVPLHRGVLGRHRMPAGVP